MIQTLMLRMEYKMKTYLIIFHTRGADKLKTFKSDHMELLKELRDMKRDKNITWVEAFVLDNKSRIAGWSRE